MFLTPTGTRDKTSVYDCDVEILSNPEEGIIQVTESSQVSIQVT